MVGGDRARSLMLFDQQQLVWAGGSEAVLRIWRVKVRKREGEGEGEGGRGEGRREGGRERGGREREGES